MTNDRTGKAVLRSPLGILTAATATHGTGRGDDISLPRLPGFVESSFSPLAYEVSRQCLTELPGDGSRTAVVLASLQGDTITEDLAGQRMVAGRVHNPLLFMQATANSVLGYLSREFQITGQMFSISFLDDPVAELLAMADLLLEDQELDRVLVLGVELSGGERVAGAHREMAAGTGRPVPAPPPSANARAGQAAAVLLGRPGAGAPVSVQGTEHAQQTRQSEPGESSVSGEPHDAANVGNLGNFDTDTEGTGPTAHPGSIQGLFDLAAAHRRLLLQPQLQQQQQQHDGSHLLVTDPAARRGSTSFTLTAHAPAPGRNERENHAHQ